MPFIPLEEIQMAARMVSRNWERCWMVLCVGKMGANGPRILHDFRSLDGYRFTAEFSAVVF